MGPVEILHAAGTNIVLPGFLFWVALLYAGVGTFITHLIGRPLIGLYFQRQHMEADFRFSLARLREYTEQVALLNGEDAEQNMVGQRFGALIANYLALVYRRMRVTAFTHTFGQISPIIPYILSFRFLPGPVFAQLLMADEINRASPRTQSALLQAMQEQHVTVAGTRHDLPKPFHVLSTQNPLEQEGTYPLPEAQLDRFLMQIDVDYPDRDAERKILFETTGSEETRPKAAMTADDLMSAQRLVRRLPVGESVVESILALVRSARPGPEGGDGAKLIAWGPSPRASQALMLAVRARALLDGRLAPSIDDVLDLAGPVLKHRMALTFAARAEGESIEAVIARLKARIG